MLCTHVRSRHGLVGTLEGMYTQCYFVYHPIVCTKPGVHFACFTVHTYVVCKDEITWESCDML